MSISEKMSKGKSAPFDVLFASLEVHLLVLYAVVTSSSMHKDSADISSKTPTSGMRGSWRPVGGIIHFQLARSVGGVASSGGSLLSPNFGQAI